MNPIVRLANFAQDLLDRTRAVDFLAPLALRLYLVPIFWMAGTKKLGIDPTFGPTIGLWFASLKNISVADTAAWFGNPDWGLGLPHPELMAWAASLTELLGAILLLIGLGVRWISIPLMAAMVVAMVTVHWQNGWLAIAEGAGSVFATDRTIAAMERLERGKSILQEHGNYDRLTEYGNFVILNNGIEFASTYFFMLLVLFFVGAGRYLSVDGWLYRKFRSQG
jgi:uncharacterized membrane protein YphA (DoxX/SURF4 family)